MRRPRLTFFVGMLGGFAAGMSGFGLFRLLHSGSAEQAENVEVDVGTVRLHVDRALIRFDEQRHGGRQDRLDLAVLHPNFRPAGKLDEVVAAPADLADKMLFLSLTPMEGALDPADSPVKLYARFLTKDSLSGPGGLIKRRFETNSPFANEDLYLAPPEGRSFAARCEHRPSQAPLPETCRHEFWLNGIAVAMRFSPQALPQWEAMKARTTALIVKATR
jgi:hypothetical protein